VRVSVFAALNGGLRELLVGGALLAAVSPAHEGVYASAHALNEVGM
jgi:hypothetical protein